MKERRRGSDLASRSKNMSKNMNYMSSRNYLRYRSRERNDQLGVDNVYIVM